MPCKFIKIAIMAEEMTESLATISQLSISLSLPILDILYKYYKYVTFCVLLILLSILLPRFIHIVACIST